MKMINLNDTLKEDLIKKFTNYLNTTKIADDRVYFSTELTSIIPTNTPRPTVYINADAYLKMLLYVRDTDIEIAWHGTVERNVENNWYYIKDVFLYPQTIASATVDTDQEKYNQWVETLDDDTFNSMRFQGHSHVNMGVTPSGTDMRMYHNFLQVLSKSDYYIFMILNKTGNMTCLIYDLAKNLMYETADITIRVITEHSNNIIDEIKEQKERYCTRPVVKYTGWGSYGNYSHSKLYEDTEEYLMNRDLPKTDTEDINDYLDEIDQRWKNSKLNIKKGKVKVKGGKK